MCVDYANYFYNIALKVTLYVLNKSLYVRDDACYKYRVGIRN